MLRRNSRAYRLTLLAVALLVVGGIGGFVYYLYAEGEATADLPETAKQTYLVGKQALEAQELSKAFESLEAANILTGKALAALEDEIRRTKNPPNDLELKWAERRGRLVWLKAQILRDTAFTNGLIENKPLTETRDTTTGEMFRSILTIPAPEVRNDAVSCLREAAFRIPRDEEIQQEALRLEMMLEPKDWSAIERLSRRLIDLKPDNIRAHYNLALLEFSQPQESTGKPTADKDKSRERVEAAREHLQVVKKASYFPIWRTLDLEARIMQWLARKPSAGSRDKIREDELRLKAIFFDPTNGVFVRAKSKEGFEALGQFDIEGLRDLHSMAVDFGIEQAKTSMGSQVDELFVALRATTDLAIDLSTYKEVARYRSELLADALAAASRARRYLGSQSPAEWPVIRDNLEKLARQSADANVSSPAAFAMLAQMLFNEAFLEGKKNNLIVKRELETRALNWIDEGLRLAVDAKEPGANLVELYRVGIEIMLSRNEKMEKLTPYLNALRKINDPRANAILDIHEAAALVRQGKLSKAEQILKKLLENDRAKDFRSRALTLLANVSLSTQKPVQAVAALRDLDRSYVRVEDLGAVERAFMLEFLRDPQDISALIVLAELETALEKLDRYYKENPGRPLLDPTTQRTIQSHEDGARGSLARLKQDTDANRQARSTFVNYYLRRGMNYEAEQTVKLLKMDYPNSAEVLRLDVAIALLPDPNIKDDAVEFGRRKQKADAMIQAFITAHPMDMAAKRFWAEWLILTNRRDEALAYIESPKNFPVERDEATKRMLAYLMVSTSSFDDGVKMLQQLPKDREIEFMLIQTTANPASRKQLLDDALSKHENNGAFRLMEGERLIAARKFAEAAEWFWRTTEFTSVTAQARAGLLRSLFRLADTDPDQALQFVQQCSAEAPNEAVFYAMAAYSLMRKDEFGSPTDVWENKKTMYGALRAWEAAAAKGGIDPSSKMLFRAQFWILANRPDLAWLELEPAVTVKPRNEIALGMLIDLATQIGEPAYLEKAIDYVGLLKEIRPNDPNTRILEAYLINRLGDRERANAILQDTLEKNPRASGAYPPLIRNLNEMKQSDKAIAWTNRWAKAFPDEPLPILERVRQLVADGQKDRAIETSEALIIENVDRLEKRLVKSTDADLDKSKKDQLKALRSRLALALAQAWQEGGDLKTATEFVERSLKEDPKNLTSRLYKGQLMIARSDWANARKTYEEILKDEPKNYVAQTNLGWLLSEHFDDPAEGLKLLREQAIGRFSGKPVSPERLSPEFLHSFGKVLEQASKKKVEQNLPEEMKQIFEPASRRYPSDPQVFLYLGEAYAGLSENEQASAAYQNALRLAQAGKGQFTAEQRRDFIKKVNDLIKGL